MSSANALSQSYPAHTWAKRWTLNPWFWVLFCSFFFAYPIVRSVNRKLPLPNPVLYQLPQYELINQYGKPFGSEQLAGKFYIAHFFFSSCPTICPELLGKVQTIQHRVRGLGTKVALVSLTVDPETDQPARLFKTARQYRANPHIWYFLTGEQSAIKDLATHGFKLPMGEAEGGTLYDIAHSEKLVLVDHQGRIRGFYASDKTGINQLMIDLGLLVNRERS